MKLSLVSVARELYNKVVFMNVFEIRCICGLHKAIGYSVHVTYMHGTRLDSPTGIRFRKKNQLVLWLISPGKKRLRTDKVLQ